MLYQPGRQGYLRMRATFETRQYRLLVDADRQKCRCLEP